MTVQRVGPASLEWIRIPSGCVWTTEFDLNALRIDEEIFWTGKEKVAASPGSPLGPLVTNISCQKLKIYYGAKAFWITCLFISRRTRLHLGTKHVQFFIVFVLKWRESVEELIYEKRRRGHELWRDLMAREGTATDANVASMSMYAFLFTYLYTAHITRSNGGLHVKSDVSL